MCVYGHMLKKIRVGSSEIIFYTPRNKVRGGILESPCPSVRLSVDAWLGEMVQSHKYFPFTPIIMKLHIQTPGESRMWPSDFRV